MGNNEHITELGEVYAPGLAHRRENGIVTSHRRPTASIPFDNRNLQQLSVDFDTQVKIVVQNKYLSDDKIN